MSEAPGVITQSIIGHKDEASADGHKNIVFGKIGGDARRPRMKQVTRHNPGFITQCSVGK